MAEELLQVRALGVEGKMVGQLAVDSSDRSFRTVTLSNTDVLASNFPEMTTRILQQYFIYLTRFCNIDRAIKIHFNTLWQD